MRRAKASFLSVDAQWRRSAVDSMRYFDKCSFADGVVRCQLFCDSACDEGRLACAFAWREDI